MSRTVLLNKNIIISILIIAAVITLAVVDQYAYRSDSSFTPQMTDETPFKTVDNLEGVTLRTTKGAYRYNVDEMIYSFKNKTGRQYTYGSEFYLEKFENGRWYQLSYAPSKFDGLWTMEGHPLKPDSVREEPLAFNWLYGNHLESGTYRLVKPIHLSGSKDSDIYYLTAVFKIRIFHFL
ncbi:immunoglobulin-like domain-containing protein [Sinanaerobacter chloroacetimidivorans]|uniref:Bacterial Ig-like domain-containing protein n=1 Tax=Sinanaerobacter chloroacetimidivorans TaxID=2818044 RepID=A0A8J8B3P1_9FIRM|nr:immunoglobulin-like domain-containing protein [Sinanaerobacter chloroacetimidivorans]MBR0599962.1 hypothetical protein [Sinanaerobacter chloroacetimidivorans]